MRKLLTLILLIAGTCQAQTPLSDSRRTSAFRYVYSISNEEALAITKKASARQRPKPTCIPLLIHLI